jgi:site-specific recombinase XerD
MNVKGYQFESCNKVRILLQDMFEKAMINDMVYKNPVRGIKLGRHDKKEPRVLTPEEQSIYFEDSLIRVNKTLVYQKFEGDEKKIFHFDEPKTKVSRRI